MLATLFGNGHDVAKSLAEQHRDHLTATGHAVGTVNRHLCTIRKTVRIAREMGEIDWDLSDVAGIAICDNRSLISNLGGTGTADNSAEGRSRCTEPLQRIAKQREAE